MWIATSERTRVLENRSGTDFGISTQVLMERAGLAVFDAVRQMLPESGRVAVLCGPGHNGGDGLVLARVAHEREYRVEVLMACREDALVPAAVDQLARARASGVQPLFPGDERYARKLETLHSNELIVDALLGIGARNAVHGFIKEAIQAINRSGVPVVSVDVPSGICCDTGEELGESIWALRTVTFGLPKPFLFQGIGLEHSGYWSVAEIGFPQNLLIEPTQARLLDGEWVANLLPERLKASHKGDNGHILIVAGSEWMPGAASLAAMSALYAGAGLVTVASIPSVCAAVAANVPAAILLPLPESNGLIDPSAVEILRKVKHKYYSGIVGPGMTSEPQIMEFLRGFFEFWTEPIVIDADALNCVSQGVPLPQAECVLTPHPGEMSRLMQCSIAEIQADRFRTVTQAIAHHRHCVLLKGPYSIVGEPNQPLMVNCTGNPGQASGGMGDVLGGIIATLMAQDLPGYYAAGCSMFWHGAAADICADQIGPIGYRASDVARALPKARARIVSACLER